MAEQMELVCDRETYVLKENRDNYKIMTTFIRQ